MQVLYMFLKQLLSNQTGKFSRTNLLKQWILWGINEIKIQRVSEIILIQLILKDAIAILDD